MALSSARLDVRKYHECAAHRHRVATGSLWIARAIAEARAPGSSGALHPCRHRPYFNSNPQSIALHEPCGLKKAGHIAKVGFPFAYLDRCRILAAHSLAMYR
jgi:L-amino acid N-acyltransferase YncA